MKEHVRKNSYGYYSLINIPPIQELKEYYQKKYYQESRGSYESNYSEEEIIYFNNKIEQKHFLLNKHLGHKTNERKVLLDIGCGEGWTLKYFRKIKWNVKGIDFSDYGCRQNNPDCLENMIIGDIYETINKMKDKNEKYDVIWLNNVLEHVVDPHALLEDCNRLIKEKGICIIEVPNDFSVLQQYLLHNNYIDDQFWVVGPDHLHYFNKEGLVAICDAAGWKMVEMISDYPIDVHLLNENTNYVRDKTKGKSCHKERVLIENIMHSISVEKTIDFYKALIGLDLGRNIIGFFHSKKKDQFR